MTEERKQQIIENPDLITEAEIGALTQKEKEELVIKIDERIKKLKEEKEQIKSKKYDSN